MATASDTTVRAGNYSTLFNTMLFSLRALNCFLIFYAVSLFLTPEPLTVILLPGLKIISDGCRTLGFFIYKS